MARASVNQGWQLGKEASAGAGGAANKKLLAYSLEPSPEFETSRFKPSGYKVPTVAQVMSENMAADYEGLLDYRNIVYVLSSLFGPVTPTQPDAATSPTVYLWTWNLDGKSKVSPQTYAIEFGEGGAGNANSFTHGVFTSAEMEISRTGDNALSGEMLGQELTTGVALTASPTEVDVEAIDGAHWDIYMADSGAGLGTAPTQLEAVYKASLAFGDMFVPEWALNSAEPSFKSVVEGDDQGYEYEMTIGADAVANAMLTTTARKALKKFFRLQATGDVIEDALNFELTIDFCATVTEADSFQGDESLYVLPLSFEMAYDRTWGKFASITVQTDIASL